LILASAEPLTPRQRAIAIAVAVVCAASRFLALARSLWDWDEALFVMAMRDYNVTLHHPHPPGFPIFIGLARLVRFVTDSDFHALQAINLVAAMLVFPALFFFARELRLRFSVAVMAAALFAFFPNVWFFGGGGFSDVPSIVLVLFAVTFMLRGAGPGAAGRNAYWLATLLLAISIGIRPQNILLGLIPGIYATLKRRPAEVLVALLIGVLVVAAAFGGAMYATADMKGYIRVVREHGDYISRVDSWRSPERPALWRLLDRFFVKQYQSPALSIVATIFALVSIFGAVRERDRSMRWNALTFVPFAIFAWLMLDRFSVSRFSIGYQPMFAIFVADGIHRVAGQRRIIAAVLAAALMAGFIAYTLPALTTVRTEIAPSLVAARAVVDHVDPRREQLFVGHTMTAFVDLVTPGFPYTRVLDDRAMPLTQNRPAWLLAELTETKAEGFFFTRERGNLWNIARRHYFEIKLAPLEQQPRFLSGWYSPEGMGTDEWRWMRGHSVMLLPPGRGRTMLRMHLGVPGEVMPLNPAITVKLNGRVIDRFNTKLGYLEKDYRVEAAPRDLPNVLELSIDRTATLPGDGRELGLRLRFLAWGPA
jgi:hypothetical protein